MSVKCGLWSFTMLFQLPLNKSENYTVPSYSRKSVTCHLAASWKFFFIRYAFYSLALLYTIPTVTNNKEICPHDTIIENEITTTTTIIYNQMIGTITTLLVLYILLTLIVVVNIINVSRGPL